MKTFAALKFFNTSDKMHLPLSGPIASVRVKGVSAMDFVTFIYIIAANVISDFVVDWLKKFFKDND